MIMIIDGSNLCIYVFQSCNFENRKVHQQNPVMENAELCEYCSWCEKAANVFYEQQHSQPIWRGRLLTFCFPYLVSAQVLLGSFYLLFACDALLHTINCYFFPFLFISIYLSFLWFLPLVFWLSPSCVSPPYPSMGQDNRISKIGVGGLGDSSVKSTVCNTHIIQATHLEI